MVGEYSIMTFAVYLAKHMACWASGVALQRDEGAENHTGPASELGSWH